MELHSSKAIQTGAVSRRLVFWLAAPLILVGLTFGGWSVAHYKHKRERTDWKTEALAQLGSLSITNAEVSRELNELKAGRKTGERQEWIGSHVLLMTNDEYLVYASHHGSHKWFVDDLFLARGSDGRWYYSSYHFCKQMAGILPDDPPHSIVAFAKTYFARPFDGQSNECLEKTWPVKK